MIHRFSDLKEGQVGCLLTSSSGRFPTAMLGNLTTQGENHGKAIKSYSYPDLKEEG